MALRDVTWAEITVTATQQSAVIGENIAFLDGVIKVPLRAKHTHTLIQCLYTHKTSGTQTQHLVSLDCL